MMKIKIATHSSSEAMFRANNTNTNREEMDLELNSFDSLNKTTSMIKKDNLHSNNNNDDYNYNNHKQNEPSSSNISKKLQSLQYVNDNMSKTISNHHHNNNNYSYNNNSTDNNNNNNNNGTTPSKVIQQKVNKGLHNLDEVLEDLFRASDQVKKYMIIIIIISLLMFLRLLLIS